MIASNKDQDDFDKKPSEWHEHLTRALLHHTGDGPHPGKATSEVDLPEVVAEMQYPPSPADIQKRQPTPPPEALGPQPPIGGGKGDKGQGKPPSQGTPTAIGAAAATPIPPPGEGEF